ncbi:squalene/phytoene synthase family protein [Myxacorys almedinensis]|uniref:Squalene/phytoene synthase family protein n=1 Tax=Myxacorys almedinensis A TaxID=2690445 RepID=A0A8J7Z257_9CYAN|nr:phytoene/squalene synthase family protein [Myxacorys almedinensis]NDJ16763.1 squalene/phytoene synthase family protein [Myxacorys almedinensis A]
MNLRKDALEVLKDTSRTFFIPISRLPQGLQQAVASAYLCMRAIDEIEDDPHLDNAVKAKILREVSLILQSGVDGFGDQDFESAFAEHAAALPEVSLRLGEWATYPPTNIAPRIWEATAAMADRMAHWAEQNWTIQTETDLDRYTFSVAGSVGLLLSDLWAWHDGTQTDRTEAIGFGRGLQSVNILRNHSEDLTRRVDFYPHGWTNDDMQAYSRRQLQLAAAYLASLPAGSPAFDFCQIILTLAHATLEAMQHGSEKLSRAQVIDLVQQATNAG